MPRRFRNVHRFWGLWQKRPRHRLKLKVWQFLLLKEHVNKCPECLALLEANERRNPTIGQPPDAN